jgi:hypothetical protein
MAIVPGASRGEGTSAARVSDVRIWWAWLAVGLVLCVTWLVVPPGHEVVRELVLYPLAELVAIAAILVGVWRYGPAAPAAWPLIAAGSFASAISDLLWGVYVVEGRDPFPSAADAFYLAGYPVIASGLVIAVLRSTR